MKYHFSIHLIILVLMKTQQTYIEYEIQLLGKEILIC